MSIDLTNNPDNDVTVLFIKRVPPKVKAEFHSFCTTHNLSMTEVIIYLMDHVRTLLDVHDIENIPKISRKGEK